MKKNCLNCKHLEWGEGDIGDPSGFICTKREYRNDKEEDDHLRKLEKDAYLEAPKLCCALKDD